MQMTNVCIPPNPATSGLVDGPKDRWSNSSGPFFIAAAEVRPAAIAVTVAAVALLIREGDGRNMRNVPHLMLDKLMCSFSRCARIVSSWAGDFDVRRCPGGSV